METRTFLVLAFVGVLIYAFSNSLQEKFEQKASLRKNTKNDYRSFEKGVEVEWGESGRKQYHEFPRFTKEGYKVLTLPKNLKKRLVDIWKNKREDFTEEEPVIYSSPLGTYIPNPNGLKILPMEQVDPQLTQEINDHVLQELIKWTGVTNLKHTATYGMREYSDGSRLRNHVDRPDTHILSAIVHVGRENLRKEWPLLLFNRDSLPREVANSEDKDDLILYESATLVHGRPTVLEGDSFVNLFIHYAPEDWKGLSATNK